MQPMNIAERILQNRFTPKSKQKQNNDTLSPNHNSPNPSQSTSNTYNNIPQQRMYYIAKQNIQYKPHPNPMSKSQSHHNIHNGVIQTTHFNIGHTISTNTTQSRPQSTSTWRRNKTSKSTNNLSCQISNAYNNNMPNIHSLSNKSSSVPYNNNNNNNNNTNNNNINKPPIKVKQSYTPPSYQPNGNNSGYRPNFNRRMNINNQFNTMQPKINNNMKMNYKPLPLTKRRSAVVTGQQNVFQINNNNNNNLHPFNNNRPQHRPRNKNNTALGNTNYNYRPLPNNSVQNIENKQDEYELPLGWAKLKDNRGYYYFNVITAEKQRTRPMMDATRSKAKKSIPNKPLPLPYSRDVAPSVHTDDMSIAEIEYRKNNGSLIFGKLLQNIHAKEDQLIQQENWDMLVDAIYLNLSPNDYITVFKALRSIAENLFDENDKYRILYADNKKVQQRILRRIGGYEFLRGLGFREVTKRKLICDCPDFDVVATAITAINAKLSIIEKGVQLPIIPDKLQSGDMNKKVKQEIRYKNVDLDGDNGKQNEIKQEEKDQIQISISGVLEEKSEAKAANLVKLSLDNVVSDVIKSDGPQLQQQQQQIENNESYSNDEDEKKVILKDTNDMDITETPNNPMEGRNNINNTIPDIDNEINNNNTNLEIESRNRTESKVTSAYFSEEEDEKLGIVMKSDNNIETDAGFIETEQYFKQQREQLQKNRKRSLSMDGNSTNESKNNKKASDVPYQSSFSPKSNHSSKSQNRHTLPPRNLVKDVNKINYVIRKKKKSSKNGRRQKAHTQHQIGHQQQRSSSVSSPRGIKLNKKNSLNAVEDIEHEVARAFVDSEQKITLNQLRLHEEEDVESLFDDDDDINYNHNQSNNIQYNDIAKPHDDFYVNVNTHNNQNNIYQPQPRKSRDDFYYNQSNYNNNSQNISGTHNVQNNNNYNSQNMSGTQNMSQQPPPNKPRSNSFGNNPFNRPLPPNPPVSLLLPSEKKKILKKGGKKKRAQKIRKSVGAFFSHFTNKKNPKYTVEDLNKIAEQRNEYRAQHPSDEEEHYAYYGDPQKQNNSPIPPKKHNKKLQNKNNNKMEQKTNEYFMAADDDYLHIKSPNIVKKNRPRTKLPRPPPKHNSRNLSPTQNNYNNNSQNISGTHSNSSNPNSSNNTVKYTNNTYINNNKHISQGYIHNPPDLLQNSVSPSYSPSNQSTQMKSIQVFFEDDTIVTIGVNINICSINVISLALEKRGWSSTMTHLFNLCIKDDDPSSDSVVMATLESDAFPIKSLPQFVKHLNLKNPIFIITYKQND